MLGAVRCRMLEADVFTVWLCIQEDPGFKTGVVCFTFLNCHVLFCKTGKMICILCVLRDDQMKGPRTSPGL